MTREPCFRPNPMTNVPKSLFSSCAPVLTCFCSPKIPLVRVRELQPRISKFNRNLRKIQAMHFYHWSKNCPTLQRNGCGFSLLLFEIVRSQRETSLGQPQLDESVFDKRFEFCRRDPGRTDVLVPMSGNEDSSGKSDYCVKQSRSDCQVRMQPPSTQGEQTRQRRGTNAVAGSEQG